MSGAAPWFYARRYREAVCVDGDGDAGGADPEGSPDSGDQEGGRRRVEATGAAAFGDLLGARAAVDTAGSAAEGADSDRAVLGAVGEAVLRAAAVRLSVPVVSGPAGSGDGLRRDDIHQEPGAVAGGGFVRGVLPRGDRGGSPEPTAVGRTLHGGRDSDRGLCLDEELSPQERKGAPKEWRKQRRGGLQGSEAKQRDPRLDDGPGGQIVPQGGREALAVVLRRPCPDGEPQRAVHGRPGIAGGWPSRTGGRAGDGATID